MQNGWVKIFADGTREVGADHAVKQGMASWTKGRQAGIVAVELWHEGVMIRISGPGQYWQSDEYEVNGRGEHTLIRRRIQKRIDFVDEFYSVNRGGSVLIASTAIHHASDGDFCRGKHVGKWVTLEIDVKRGGHTTHYLAEGKL